MPCAANRVGDLLVPAPETLHGLGLVGILLLSQGIDAVDPLLRGGQLRGDSLRISFNPDVFGILQEEKDDAHLGDDLVDFAQVLYDLMEMVFPFLEKEFCVRLLQVVSHKRLDGKGPELVVRRAKRLSELPADPIAHTVSCILYASLQPLPELPGFHPHRVFGVRIPIGRFHRDLGLLRKRFGESCVRVRPRAPNVLQSRVLCDVGKCGCPLLEDREMALQLLP